MEDPLSPHRHDPNPDPPGENPAFTITGPDGRATIVTVATLAGFPAVMVSDCTVVSTGHGTSGPFSFTGALLADVAAVWAGNLPWSLVEVISGDGFGTRVRREEMAVAGRAGQIILAYAINGHDLTRAQGLVRLIVPSETDDALRQVKWVSRINVRP